MADENKTTVTRRAGGVWEAVGTVLIIAGMVSCGAAGGSSTFGGALGGIGLLVFLVGRFL